MARKRSNINEYLQFIENKLAKSQHFKIDKSCETDTEKLDAIEILQEAIIRITRNEDVDNSSLFISGQHHLARNLKLDVFKACNSLTTAILRSSDEEGNNDDLI